MVDSVIMKANKLTATAISTLYRRSFGSKVQKASFLAENHPQNLHFSSLIF